MAVEIRESAMMRRHKWRLTAVIGILFLACAWCVMSLPTPLVLKDQRHVVGFSADGRVLATIDQNGKGCLWDPVTGQSRINLAGELSGLRFPFTPDGRYCVDLAVANHLDRRVVSNVKTGEPLFRYSYPASAGFYQTMAFGFTPDGRYFYSPISDTNGDFAATGVWSLPDGSQVHLGEEPTLAMSPDGEHLAIVSQPQTHESRRVELYSLGEQRVESSFDLFNSSFDFYLAAFSSTGDRLLVWLEGMSRMPMPVKVVDVLSSQISAEHQFRCYRLFRPRFIQNDQLFSVHRDSDAGPIAICLATADHSGIAWDIDALSANDRWGVKAFRATDELSEWFEIDIFKISADQAAEVTNQYPAATMKFPLDQWGYPPRCNISNDASRVAVSYRYDYSDKIGISDSSKIVVVDVASQDVIWKWQGKVHPDNVQLSPDGRFVAFENSILSPGVKVFQLPDEN